MSNYSGSPIQRIVDAMIRHILGPKGRLKVAERRFVRYVKSRLPRSYRNVGLGPAAPESLIRTTAGMNEAHARKWLDADYYFRSGLEQMGQLLAALDSISFNLRTLGSVYEIGCGSARLLRHLRCIRGLRLVGSDVNSACIDWCQKNIPGIEFHRNEQTPPLTFLADASVDLIIASSVFTHIPLEQQLPWLEELHRVLRPRGIVLCTVLGRGYEESMLTADDQDELQRTGHLVLSAQDDKASLATKQAGSCDVFQTRAEVVATFGSVFWLLDYVDRGAGGQDLLVLRKP